MKVLKSVLAVIIIAAVAAGIFIYVNSQNQNGGTQNAPVSEGTLVINEFLASNSSVLPDDKGKYSDWIEIYNPTGSSIDLSEYGLSNDTKGAKWTFPNIILQGNGYIVVFASGDNVKDPNAAYQHTNFKLSSSGGSIYLYDAKGNTVDKIDYERQTENISTGRDPNNLSQLKLFDKPTPGFSNNEEGLALFQESRKAEDSAVILTEVMPSNTSTIADNKGNYNDYIEIYNSGNVAVNLKDYGLSDDPDKVLKWKFPDITIEPGEYLIVFASGQDKESTDLTVKAVHTDFRLSTYKETVILSNPQGYILDQVYYTEMPPGTAFIRTEGADGKYQPQWELTQSPSPGSKNG